MIWRLRHSDVQAHELLAIKRIPVFTGLLL